MDLVDVGHEAGGGVHVGDRQSQRRQTEGLEARAGAAGQQVGQIDRHRRQVGHVGRVADGEVDPTGAGDEVHGHAVGRAAVLVGDGRPGDERAAALARREGAVGAQQVEGGGHGRAADGKLLGEATLRRQRRARRQQAGLDQPAQPVGEPLAEVAVTLVGPAGHGGGDWPAIGLCIHMPILAKWTMPGKPAGMTMDRMFAPYCTTCSTRRLLPVSRIVASDWERGGTVYVRCTCGSVIAADARPPTDPTELRRAS